MAASRSPLNGCITPEGGRGLAQKFELLIAQRGGASNVGRPAKKPVCQKSSGAFCLFFIQPSSAARLTGQLSRAREFSANSQLITRRELQAGRW